jgi:hypothetical protein
MHDGVEQRMGNPAEEPASDGGPEPQLVRRRIDSAGYTPEAPHGEAHRYAQGQSDQEGVSPAMHRPRRGDEEVIRGFAVDKKL